MIKRKLTFIEDPGHGWLSVSNADIKALGIADKISHYSYMNATRSFLEEDCDAGIFLTAAKEAGWDVTYKEKYSERTFVRTLGNYNPYFVENPLKDGSAVSVHNSRFNANTVFTYREENKKAYLYLNEHLVYSVTKSNPMRYIKAPVRAIAEI